MIDYTTFYIITVILSLHFIADFIFQPHIIAKNKSRDNWALGIHVLIYSLIMFSGYLIFLDWVFLYGYPTHITEYIQVLFLVYVSVTHFVTDWVTSRINFKLYKKGKIHEFFVGIGFDQYIHYLTLFGFVFMIEMGK